MKSYLLSKPVLYDLFQEAVGARAARERFFREYVAPNIQAHSRVLDLGCGTGLILNVLPPSIEYVGIDQSEAYLSTASRKWSTRGSFVLGDLARGVGPCITGKFDLVIAMGVFHHLSDDILTQLCASVATVLAPHGKLVSFDPCFHAGQRRLSRLLVSADRGEYVRNDRDLSTLLMKVFPNVRWQTVDDFLRIPYSHCFTVSSFS